MDYRATAFMAKFPGGTPQAARRGNPVGWIVTGKSADGKGAWLALASDGKVLDGGLATPGHHGSHFNPAYAAGSLDGAVQFVAARDLRKGDVPEGYLETAAASDVVLHSSNVTVVWGEGEYHRVVTYPETHVVTLIGRGPEPAEKKYPTMDDAQRKLNDAMHLVRVNEYVAGMDWAVEELRTDGHRVWGPDALRIANWLERQRHVRVAELLGPLTED